LAVVSSKKKQTKVNNPKEGKGSSRSLPPSAPMAQA